MADSIQLFLIRHGIAADRGPAWPDDGKRPLTEKGVARLRREVKALAALDVSFDLVLVSPPVTVTDALAPSGTPAQVVEELGKHTRRRRIALVGHEPNLGELAARLIGSRAAIDFKKGAICRIDVETLPPSRAGRLRWFATPRILRALGK